MNNKMKNNKDQVNPVSGTVYQGGNLVKLRSLADEKNYKSNQWITFLQAKQMGRFIKKGEHGTSVFRGFADEEKISDKTGKSIKESYPLGSATVFNMDQLDLAVE